MSQHGGNEQPDRPVERRIPPRPVALDTRHEGIPAEMRELRRWVVWAYVWRASETGEYRWTKSPYSPRLDDDGRHPQADSTDPRTWGTYAEAAAFADRYTWTGADGVDGIGFVLSGSGATGVDFDHCRDPATGEVDPWVAAQVDALGSYTEVSPSGTGVKSIVYGEKPAGRCRNYRIEMYSAGRFFTVTGHVLPGKTGVRDAGDALREIHVREFPPEEPTSPATVGGPRTSWLPADEVILDRARNARNGDKFTRLFDGGWAGEYPSQSEADRALCSILAWWANNDPVRIDALFRRSNLYRDKWERDDYRARTLGPVLDGECYDWSRHESADAETRVEAMFGTKQAGQADGHTPRGPDRDGGPEFDPSRYRPKPTNAKRRRGLTADEIETLPCPEWVVRRHLTRGSLCLLAGPPGAGKSYLSLDLALCVCTGRAMFGQFKTRGGAVGYISSEGEAGLKYRLRAWRQYHGVEAVPDGFKAYPYRYDLLAPDEAAGLLEQMAEDFGGRLPDLVIVDTLARNFGGGDENSTKDMNQFVRSIDLLRAAGPAVLVVHHTGKDSARGERGNSALRGAADAVFLAERGGHGLYLSCSKMKDGQPPSDYVLHFCPQVVGTDPDGEPVESAVLEYAGSARDAERAAKGQEQDRNLAGLGVGSAGVTAAEAGATWGISRQAATSRLDGQVAAGRLVKVAGSVRPPAPARWFPVAS